MEEKQYMTLDEVAEYLSIKRASLYNYMRDLNIKPHKFGRKRQVYLALAEVLRIQEYKQDPWKVEEETKKEAEHEVA